jgi:hypothetical protein
MKLKVFVCGLLFFGINIGGVALGQSKNRSDDRLYDDLRTIQGKIVILNHPQLGRTEGRNIHVLFQRMDCKRCVFSVQSDSDGNYSMTVAKGRYRVIARGPKETNGENYDLLSPSQKRTVEATSGATMFSFDVEILLP